MVCTTQWPSQLFLAPPSGAVGDAPKVFNKVVASSQGQYEPCGRAYHLWLYPMDPNAVKPKKAEKVAEVLDPEFEKLKVLLMKKDVDLEDNYALLGLSDFRFIATEKQIKYNYTKGALVCHPDKATPEDRSQAEARYKAMQRAYDQLLDPTKRKLYDSSLPFNDKLPKATEGNTPETFFKVYGRVFQDNSRFSIDKKIPDLGDADTDMKQVDKFYSWWFSFKSWREFSHPDEKKPDDGTCREEKRKMETENKKLRASAKRDETKRVSKLVEEAMKKDPRIQKKNAELEAEKNKKKDEKKNKILEKQQAEQKKLDDIQAAKDEEEALRKKLQNENKNNKQIMKKLRQRLRKTTKDESKCGTIDQEEVEQLNTAFGPDKLTALCDGLDAAAGQGVEAVQAVFIAAVNSIRTAE